MVFGSNWFLWTEGENRNTRRKLSRARDRTNKKVSNPGHIGGRQVFSPLRHPCFPRKKNTKLGQHLRCPRTWEKSWKKFLNLLKKLDMIETSDKSIKTKLNSLNREVLNILNDIKKLLLVDTIRENIRFMKKS